MSPFNEYRPLWDELDAQGGPKYVKEIHVITYDSFRKRIEDDTEKMIRDIHAGTAFVIRNIIDPRILDNIRSETARWGRSTEPQKIKITEGCKNYHTQVKCEVPLATGYQTIAHSHFYFRWCQESNPVFAAVDPHWQHIKHLSGLKRTAFNSNTPKDGVVDRIQVVRYPLDHGKISCHVDTPKYQKLGFCMSLGRFGTDFTSGGYYLLDKDENKLYLDGVLSLGSAVCWYPAIYHGVDPPKLEGSKADSIHWRKDDGRWNMIIFTPESHEVEDRTYSQSIEQVKNADQS